MVSLRAFSLAVPLAFVAVSSAQTVTLRYLPPIGKPMRFTVVNNLTQSMAGMPASKMTQTIPMTMKALSRKGGDTTVEVKTGTMKIDMPASSPMARAKDAMVRAGSGKTSTVVVDQYGKPKSVATVGSAGMAQMGGIQGVAFPVKPVKVGDTWTVDLDMAKMAPGGGAGMKIKGRIPMRYTLKSVNTVGGRKIATIGVVINGSAQIDAMGQPVTMRMTGTGTVRLDPATGTLVDSRVVMDNATSFGKGQAMKQRIDIAMKAG